MEKSYIKMNTILLFIGFHLAVAFTMYFGLALETRERTLPASLLWLIPLNLLFASMPNLLLLFLRFLKKRSENRWKSFFIGELYVVLIQLFMHGVLLLLFIYAPKI